MASQAPRVARALGVRAGEAGPVALLFGWYFCVIGAAFIGRAVRDSLFLAHLSAARLPIMYVVSPLVLTAVGFGYARIEGRFRRDRLAIATAAGFGGVILAARALVGTGDWIFYALYVLANVMSGLVIMQLWMVASDRFHARDAKRLFGLIGAGGTAADIVIGAVLALLAPRLGAEDMLYLCAALLFAAAAIGLALARRGGSPAPGPARGARTRGGGALPPGASHLRVLGGALVCAVAVVTLVEFQFKAVTAAAFGDDRAGMVSYFGWMSIATGVVSLAIQLAATRWLVARLGVVDALLVLPLGLAAGEAGLAIVPGLLAATVLKASDETFRFTVNDAATQLVYLPVPSRARGRFKSLIENALKPGAQLVIGGALLAYGRWWPGRIGPLVLVAGAIIAVWIAVLVRLRAAYVGSLRETLRRRPAALAADAPAAIPREEADVVREALATGDDDAVRAALTVARALTGDRAIAAAAARHLAHADPIVRRDACAAIGGAMPAAAGDLALLAALRAGRGDGDAGVRAEALAGLLRAGDDDARGAIEDRVRAADAGARDEGAAALAAARLAQPALVPALLDHAGDEAVIEALGACAAGAEDALAAAALDPARPPEVRRGAIRALGGAATPAAIAHLGALIAGDDERVRATAARSLARAHRAAPGAPLDDGRLRAAIDRELAAAYRAMACAEDLGRPERAADGTSTVPPLDAGAREGAAALLSKTLRERQDHARDGALALVEVLCPDAGLEAIATNLREPDPVRRANAVELLDSVLDPELRRRLVPLVDESPRWAKLEAIAPVFPQERRTAAERIAELLDDARRPWLVACAAYWAGAHGEVAAAPRLEALLGHADAVVRETAFDALLRLVPDPSRRAELASRVAHDRFAPLAARAARQAGAA